MHLLCLRAFVEDYSHWISEHAHNRVLVVLHWTERFVRNNNINCDNGMPVIIEEFPKFTVLANRIICGIPDIYIFTVMKDARQTKL